MGCILASQWLKRIPSDFNLDKLTRTKFIWYLLKQDALEEPTRDGDYKQAIEDNAVKTIKGYISRIYGWFQIWK